MQVSSVLHPSLVPSAHSPQAPISASPSTSTSEQKPLAQCWLPFPSRSQNAFSAREPFARQKFSPVKVVVSTLGMQLGAAASVHVPVSMPPSKPANGHGLHHHKVPPPEAGGSCHEAMRALVGTTLAEMEREFIEITIAECGGSIPRAARLLDVSPSTLYRKREAWARSA